MRKFIIAFAFMLFPCFITPCLKALDIDELQQTYNIIAAKASKAVVNVQVIREDEQKVIVPEYFFGYIFPEERVYRHKTSGLGSGVIIDPRGYVLTNYHVLADAVDIKIVMQDQNGNERTYMALNAASDPALDIALLKIKEGGDFPYLQLNYSQNIKVGDIVMAVGYPFGFKQSFTSGIISALNAKLQVEGRRYEHLIQTDAAINPGNSGGPLLNLNGEVIGINTAIASPSGAFAGMGFAVSVGQIKPVLEDMLAGRKIRRAWLGVSVMRLDSVMAMRFGMNEAKGALVNQVITPSPAEAAGIRRGDIILKFNNEAIEDADALVFHTFSKRPGESVILEIMRRGKVHKVRVCLGDRERLEDTSAKPQPLAEKTFIWEGLELSPNAQGGALVIAVRQGSKLRGHLLKGDIINAVNGIKIAAKSDLRKAFMRASISEGVLFDITRDNQPTYVSVQIAR